MATSNTSKLPAVRIPSPIRELLGNPPLVAGEDAAGYEALLLATAAAAKPEDAIEWLYVKDFADLTWEIHRNRRYAARIVSNDIAEALCVLLSKIKESDPSKTNNSLPEARKLAYAYCAGKAEARRSVSKLLKDAGLNDDSATALAFSRKLEVLEAAARMAANAETRRDQMLREIDRHREIVRKLRSVIDGEFDEVPKLDNQHAGNPATDAPAANTA